LHAAPLAEHVIELVGTQCFVGGLVVIGMSSVQLEAVDWQQSEVVLQTVAALRVALGTMHCGSTQKLRELPA
jgi:hypothetical protein